MADAIAPRGLPSQTRRVTVRFLASILEAWLSALGRWQLLADLIALP